MLIGDLVSSSEIPPEHRGAVHRDLEHLLSEISERYAIYRGDTFQIEMPLSEDWVERLMILRSQLRRRDYATYQLDARIGIGIGSVIYQSDNVQTSDGPVYAYANEALEQTKAHHTRLYLCCEKKYYQKYHNIILTLLDAICMEWTVRQAEIISYYLKGQRQLTIAEKLGISQSTVQRSLKASKARLIRDQLKELTELQAYES